MFKVRTSNQLLGEETKLHTSWKMVTKTLSSSPACAVSGEKAKAGTGIQVPFLFGKGGAGALQ